MNHADVVAVLHTEIVPPGWGCQFEYKICLDPLGAYEVWTVRPEGPEMIWGSFGRYISFDAAMKFVNDDIADLKKVIDDDKEAAYEVYYESLCASI